MQSTPSPERSRDIVLVSGADDGYAMPLAVTIRSALDCLAADRRMKLFVIDGGLTDGSKSRLLASWNDLRLTVEWLRADVDLFRDLPVDTHITTATYLRLLMPRLLPQDVERVIYLDSDLLVRRDLADLWDEPQGGHAVLAVQDVAAPCLDAAACLPNYDRCRNHLAAFTPVPNFRELGLPPDALYFNGGLLVVDLAQWRRERSAERLLQCLDEHREHVLWCDQYALNVVFAGKWRALDRRWNQGAHIFVYPTWWESPFDRETFRLLRAKPWIVHFCSPTKPWHYFCRHPFKRRFRKCVRRTAWKDWRPESPQDYFRQWRDCHYWPLRQEWKSRTRAFKQAIGYKRRRAA